MSTETADPRYTDLDAWPTARAMEAMWEGQAAAMDAVKRALPQLARAAEAAAERLSGNGRLVYVGAGTSGRIAVQDGAELGPTFGWPSERLAFAMAGGEAALINSVEGAEDDAADGAAQMARASVGPDDVVIGVAASGSTPFTLAAVREARGRGALTIGIANNPGATLIGTAEFPVLLDTGSEVLAGSTRMMAGTAQKTALNLISTAVMIQLGRVYKGQMVDMQLSNAKLRKRAEKMVAGLAGCGEAEAAAALAESRGRIKAAVLVAMGRSAEESEALLAANGGNLRRALG